ncbi:MAG: hypothetical protein ACXADO_01230 [Candidatus Thorarchaeota archaeon]|jgi:hypothetical protein
MNSEDIRHFEADTSLGKVRIRVIDLDNGTLLLLSDSERFRLGLSAVAIPPGRDESEPTSSGLFSTGLDTILVRTLAERVVSWTGRTCMAVVAVKGLNQKVLLELMAALKDFLLT